MSGINFEAMSKEAKTISGLVDMLWSTEPVKLFTRVGVVEFEVEDRKDIDVFLLGLLKEKVKALNIYVN